MVYPQSCCELLGYVVALLSDNLFARSLIARALNSAPATPELLDAILEIHPVDVELSLSNATCLCRRSGTTASITSHRSSSPSISKSEFVIVPPGFL